MALENKCAHDWQPAKDLLSGRYRCTKCPALGFKNYDGDIVESKSRPSDYAAKELSYADYKSFYGEAAVGGRHPTLDEQERRLADWHRGVEDDDMDT